MTPNVTVRVTDERTGLTETYRTHNTICAGYHRLLVRLVDPEDDLSSDDLDFELALGEDNTTDPAYGNTALNAQITRTEVTDFINEDTDFYTSTFVDNGEANPTDGSSFQSIVEIGVVAIIPAENTEYLCNHSLINEIQKTNQKTATIESTLELNNDTADA